jgi:hypothetical protein
VINEVMAEKLDEKCWEKYRQRLEKRFKQEMVIVRAQEVRTARHSNCAFALSDIPLTICCRMRRPDLVRAGEN